MMDRRSLLALMTAALAAPTSVIAQEISRTTAFAFSFVGIDGQSIRLANHAGRPILVVNTASQCGYTPQYAGLQKLWERYHSRGLLIIGVPSNDFGNQEPGGPKEILQTASGHYGITFPLAAKVAVRGEHAHPFYKWASLQRPGAPRWNFHKFLIGRDGRIVGSFPASVDPLDPELTAAIERELPAV
ncbi:MAG TPA: glutathione peroxidase [Xanthobacteraceae bacterium]|nr:glutathione peroxidase [Xanthobacteraceae bacterium]